MKAAVDTSILIRAVLWDDRRQARAAGKLLREASLVAVPLPCLCECVWVLRRGAGLATSEVIRAIEALMAASSVVMNRPAVEAGLAVLAAGGDFADGVIAHEGRWLGGEAFISFDADAVKLLAAQGHDAQVLR